MSTYECIVEATFPRQTTENYYSVKQLLYTLEKVYRFFFSKLLNPKEVKFFGISLIRNEATKLP